MKRALPDEPAREDLRHTEFSNYTARADLACFTKPVANLMMNLSRAVLTPDQHKIGLTIGSIRRILVVKLRHLGDVLLTTPVFQVLRAHFPSAQLTACVNAGTEGILDGNPFVDQILTVRRGGPNEGRLRGWLAAGSFLLEVRRARFDLVIELTGSDRAAILSRASGSRHRLAYASRKGFVGKNSFFTHLAERQPNLHIVRQNLELLRPLGLSWEKPGLSFAVSPADRNSIDRLVGMPKRIVHVHPVSRIAVKCWPAPFMSELLDYLSGRGLTPVITASSDPVELRQVAELLSLVRAPCVDLSGRLTLKQLGALSERAECFVGVDSAPMHIAAAVGTPVIALFGPSSENLWGPWCERQLVVSRKDLACRLPCKNKRGCQTIHCLREFTPEAVVPQVEAFLQELKQVN